MTRLPVLAALAALALLSGCASPAALTPSSAPFERVFACVASPCATVLDDARGGAFEPMVAVDPSDPDHLVAAYSETSWENGFYHRWNKAAVSTDGGATWKVSRLPGGPAAGPTHPLFAATDMGDASATILHDGTVVYTGLALHFVMPDGAPLGLLSGYTLFAARSTDGGFTYPEVSVVARGHGLIASEPFLGGVPVMWRAHDKNYVASGAGGTVLVAWSQIQVPATDPPELGRGDLTFSLSKDGGMTWSAPAPISKGPGVSGAAPAVGPDGVLYVAHFQYGAGDLRLATSKDDGKTWSVEKLRDDGSKRMPNFPNLVERGGRLFLTYTHATDEGEETPRLMTSEDGGGSWGEPLDLVAEPNAAIWSQPTLAVLGDGTSLVAFYRGDDAQDDKALVVVAVPLGGNVSAPLLLDAGLAGSTGQRGHYIGIAPVPSGGLVVWPGGKPGSYDLLGARVTLS